MSTSKMNGIRPDLQVRDELRAAPADLSDKPVYGHPRYLPVVLLCHATVEWCGSKWIANNMADYEAHQRQRHLHEKTCEAVQELKKSGAPNMHLYRG